MTAKAPSVLGALTRALPKAPDARDVAAVALAKQYAALIDEAAPAAKYREPLRELRALVEREAADQDGGPDLDKHMAKIEAALSAHTVASDLGPKLLAVLAELQMTPKARQAVVKGGSGDGGADAGGGKRAKLLALRAEHDARTGTH